MIYVKGFEYSDLLLYWFPGIQIILCPWIQISKKSFNNQINQSIFSFVIIIQTLLTGIEKVITYAQLACAGAWQ